MLYDELRDRLEVERRGMTETKIDLIRWDLNFSIFDFWFILFSVASFLQSEAHDCYVFASSAFYGQFVLA